MTTAAEGTARAARLRRTRLAAKSAAVGLLLAALVMPSCGLLVGAADGAASTGSGIADAALAEFESYDGGSSEGYKYIEWFYGTYKAYAWCAIFASYVCDQAGLEAGVDYPPKSSGASCSGWISFYRDNSDAGTIASTSAWDPQPGDLLVKSSHITVVVGYDEDEGTVETVGGNESDTVSYHVQTLSSARQRFTYYIRTSEAGSFSSLLSSCSAAAAEADSTVTIPDGLGGSMTYMGWSLVTSPSSTQYKLREQAGEEYDDEGFAVIDGRYVVACTQTYGDVGDLVDFELADGTVIECVIGDVKSQSDDGCNKWGHDDGQCIIEFVVDYDTWYSGGSGSHANPGTASCHPEWDQCVASCTNYGSWFDGGTGGLSGCSAA